MLLAELLTADTAPTIAIATKSNGNINRKTADRILDPQGYFEKNKRANFRGKKVSEDHGNSITQPYMPVSVPRRRA